MKRTKKIKPRSSGIKALLQNRAYKNILPQGYDNPVGRVVNGIVLNKKEDYADYGQPQEAHRTLDNVWAEYLNIPEDQRRYKNKIDGVTKYTENGNDYVQLNNQNVLLEDIQPTLLGGMTKHISPQGRWDYEASTPADYGQNRNVQSNFILGDFQTMRKVDPRRGEYVQYTDTWDINPYQYTENIYGQVPYKDMPWYDKLGSKIVNRYIKNNPGKDATFGVGNPLNIKGNIYLEDMYGVPKGSSAPQKGDYFGGWLPEVTVIKHRE